MVSRQYLLYNYTGCTSIKYYYSLLVVPRAIQNTQTPQAGNLVPIVLDSVNCNGRERSLSECSRATYVEGCTHVRDVGVNCTQTIGELQLELGPTHDILTTKD